MNVITLEAKRVLMVEEHQRETKREGCALTICQMWLLYKKSSNSPISYIPAASKFAITMTFPARQAA